MKKINSIGYGHLILRWIIFFLFVLPLSFYIAYTLFQLKLFSILMKTSFGLGLLLSVGFIVLLTIELHQDKKLDQYYSCTKDIKLPLSSGKYECQLCGNKNLTKKDTFCQVCGQKFKHT